MRKRFLSLLLILAVVTLYWMRGGMVVEIYPNFP